MKEDAKECLNCRTTALTFCASEVMLKVMQQRCLPYTEQDVLAVQVQEKEEALKISLWAFSGHWGAPKNFRMPVYVSQTIVKSQMHQSWKTMDGLLWEMGVPQHLIVLMSNLYFVREATVQTEYGETEWFPIDKGIDKGAFYHPIYLICTKTIHE